MNLQTVCTSLSPSSLDSDRSIQFAQSIHGSCSNCIERSESNELGDRLVQTVCKFISRQCSHHCNHCSWPTEFCFVARKCLPERFQQVLAIMRRWQLTNRP